MGWQDTIQDAPQPSTTPSWRDTVRDAPPPSPAMQTLGRTLSGQEGVGEAIPDLTAQAVRSGVSAIAPTLPADYDAQHPTMANSFASGVRDIGEGAKYVGNMVADALPQSVKDTASQVANSRWGQDVGNMATIAGAAPIAEGAVPLAKDALGAGADGVTSAKDTLLAKRTPYDADAAHAAISDSYEAARQKTVPYYNLMKSIASGKTADATGLKSALDSVISDIRTTPFHESSTILPDLVKQSAKIGEDGTMPLNDMVKLKQNLNENFNPKRFSQGADSPYSSVGNIVDNSLNEASQRIPEFWEAKSLADKNWLNTVKLPFQNDVLQRFWKPDDFYAKKSVENGMAESMNDFPETKERAQQMVGNISNPVELNAIRKVLPQDVANDLSQAKIQDITQGVGSGRLQAAGKAVYYGTTGRLPTALRSAANVISPSYTPDEQALIQAAKSPAPSLSTKYEKPFSNLKASMQQMKDSEEEMQPMQYGPSAPPLSTAVGPKARAQVAGNVYQGAMKRPFKSAADSPAGDVLKKLGGINSMQDIAPGMPELAAKQRAAMAAEDAQRQREEDQMMEQMKGPYERKRGGSVPSPAQAAAGNYKKGHIKFQGLDISIETPKGAIRRGNGWQNVSPADYGYFKRSIAADGEHVDCYVGPNHKSNRVYVIDQHHLHNGKYDEAKVMLGFENRDDAIACYKAGFSDGKGKQRIGKITRMSVPGFKEWLTKGNTTKPIKKAA